ncbi:alpha/beta hydrolase [Nocardia transvalensis]|uniref:alpha/beta hydrolase n=1 Tax=Nocardia transvalensis TaxID=37333 RepID=UPI001893983D|nr:alpha/beta hydrolase [Nocardia transvalensis]MBF6329439.1 alpha/beta hydrolase [Nocardia transvalensis]
MENRRIAVGDRAWTVRVSGPQSRHTVLLLPDAGDPPDVYDEVCTRLHTSDLRTIAIEDIDGLDIQAVYALLDDLGVPWAHLVGCGAGATLAWQLGGRGFGRFIGLVAAGRGHPAAPAADGTIADPTCPAVELPTTVVATKQLPWSVAEASGRFVFGEFRVAQADVTDPATEAAHELATEIVLRSGLW